MLDISFSYLAYLSFCKDISGINAVNLATLPENYNEEFYRVHLSTWPSLAVVAECDSEPQNEDATAFKGSDRPPILRPKKEIIGYVLGRMDTALGGGVRSSSRFNPERLFVLRAMMEEPYPCSSHEGRVRLRGAVEDTSRRWQ
jgi:ribosomal protein S18 acetylase RimI-like enzyme